MAGWVANLSGFVWLQKTSSWVSSFSWRDYGICMTLDVNHTTTHLGRLLRKG